MVKMLVINVWNIVMHVQLRVIVVLVIVAIILMQLTSYLHLIS